MTWWPARDQQGDALHVVGSSQTAWSQIELPPRTSGKQGRPTTACDVVARVTTWHAVPLTSEVERVPDRHPARGVVGADGLTEGGQGECVVGVAVGGGGEGEVRQPMTAGPREQ